MKGKTIYRSLRFEILERECVTSLKVSGRSDRRNSSGQEGRSLYAVRPTSGLRF